MIRRMLPLAEILCEPMFLRILMDINDKLHQIGCAVRRYSLERPLEQCTRSLCGNIDTPALRDGTDVLPPQIKKVSVIPFLEEDVLVVIAAVINVIEVSIRESRDG